MADSYSSDIVIFGGGIAGLWLLNKLQGQGYDTILIEKSKLGGGQTLASQGIIHGGIKYALDGVLSSSSSVIADMPERWRRCLKGESDIDLRGCKILSDHYYMWSDSSLVSRMKTFLGSKALRGRVDALEESQYPQFFRSQTSGSLYQLPDFVLDPGSLVETLANHHRDQLFSIDAADVKFNLGNEGEIESLDLGKADSSKRLIAQRYIFCAGEGNASLLNRIGSMAPAMQTRSLHMTIVKHNHPHSAFAHCVGNSFSAKPRLTITSHSTDQGETLWYLGGELAEQGVTRNSGQQIEAAKNLLLSLFPSIDFSEASWASFLINRAEPAIANLRRPDSAYTYASNNYFVCWPTKLTLCPHLGDELTLKLQNQGIVPATPNAPSAASSLSNSFSRPEIAKPRWEEYFQ